MCFRIISLKTDNTDKQKMEGNLDKLKDESAAEFSSSKFDQVCVCVCVLGIGRGWQDQKCYHTDNGVFFASSIMFWILTVQSGQWWIQEFSPGL